MTNADNQKQSLHFPEEMLSEVRAEAERLDRSLSWVLQRAWKLARKELAKQPGTSEPGDDSGDDDV